MFRIDNTSAVPSLPIIPPTGIPGFFSDGNETLGIQATIVDAWWANMLQEEILAVVNAASITPSKTDNGQLLKALNHIFAAAGLYLPLAGGTMTGFPLLLARDPVLNMEAATRQFVLAQLGVGATGFLPLTGGTLHNPGGANPLTIQADQGLQAQTRYVNTNVGSWRAGVGTLGNFAIVDEASLPNPRLQVALGTGQVTIYQSLTIGGGTVGGQLLTLSAAANLDADIYLINPARTWRLGLRGDNSFFAISDLTANLERLSIDLSGNVSIDVGALSVSQGITAGNDILLSRPQANSYIVRPNVAGQKTLNFAVQGGGPLDTLGLIAAQTTATGAFGASGVITGNAGAHFAGLNPQNYGLVVDNVALFSGGLNSSGSIDVSAGNLTVNNALIANTAGGVTVYGGLNVSTGNVSVTGNITTNFLTSAGATFTGNVNVPDIFGTNTGGVEANVCNIHGPLVVYPAATVAIYSQGNINCAGQMVMNNGAVITSTDLNIQTGNAYKPGDGSWGTYGSSRLVKKDIEPYTRGLEAINALRPVTYKYNGLGGLPDNGKTYHGLIIEDISEIMPELIGDWYAKLRDDDAEETNIHTYTSTAITYALINAIQELMAKVEALEARA